LFFEQWEWGDREDRLTCGPGVCVVWRTHSFVCYKYISVFWWTIRQSMGKCNLCKFLNLENFKCWICLMLLRKEKNWHDWVMTGGVVTEATCVARGARFKSCQLHACEKSHDLWCCGGFLGLKGIFLLFCGLD
jgi:hypothetical protein